MEDFYHSLAFKNLANNSFEGIKYNSIRDRLVIINPDYFEAIFNSCLTQFQDKYLKKKRNIISFDSTMVSISSKLLETIKKQYYDTQTICLILDTKRE